MIHLPVSKTHESRYRFYQPTPSPRRTKKNQWKPFPNIRDGPAVLDAHVSSFRRQYHWLLEITSVHWRVQSYWRFYQDCWEFAFLKFLTFHRQRLRYTQTPKKKRIVFIFIYWFLLHFLNTCITAFVLLVQSCFLCLSVI